MIKVTLEFPTVDAAIVALGKLVSAAATPKASRPESSPTPPAAAEPKRGRGRPPKNVAAPDALATSAPASTPSAPEAPVAATPNTDALPQDAPAIVGPTDAITIASAKDAENALANVLEKHGVTLARSVLAAFHVTRLRDLKPEDRVAFIQHATKAAA